MAKGELTGARLEGVSPEDIADRLVGNDLNFAVASIEIIVFDDSFRFLQRAAACSDADGFEAVAISLCSILESIVIDAGMVRGGISFEPDSEGDAFVIHPGESAVIDAIVHAVNGDPFVVDCGVIRIEVGDRAMGETAMVGEI